MRVCFERSFCAQILRLHFNTTGTYEKSFVKGLGVRIFVVKHVGLQR